MQNGSFPYVLLAGLAIALVVAAATDLHHRRIGNGLNAAIALGAPLFWWSCGLPPGAIAWQIGVALATLLVLGAMFALRAIGGGDVKLLVALALWIKPAWFLNLVTIMALVGGVLTLTFAAWHVARRQKDRMAIPYGVAIAVAGLWVLGTDYLPAAPGMGPMAAHQASRPPR